MKSTNRYEKLIDSLLHASKTLGIKELSGSMGMCGEELCWDEKST